MILKHLQKEKFMNLRNSHAKRLIIGMAILFCFGLFLPKNILAQDLKKQRVEAMKLVNQNRYIDALPIFEEIAILFPKDSEVWAHYGIAILVNSSTLETPAVRKAERKRAIQALTKAKQLGTEVVLALHYLDIIPADGGENDNFAGDDEEVEKFIREGEGFFGRGEYAKAFASYEKAYKINPKSYEAVLFMGDSLYAARKYKESEPWFAKAVEINPNREEAYRYWGDALAYQDKNKEAYQKFAEAFIADPFSRIVRDRFFRAVEEFEAEIAPISTIVPPGGKFVGDIKFDPTLLKAEDGTIYWKLYTETRNAWKTEEFKKQFSDKETYRRTLLEEAAALRKVVEAVKKDKKIKKLDDGLANLVKLEEFGLLESYIFFVRPDNEILEDYFDYRKNNREKLRRFLYDHFFIF